MKPPHPALLGIAALIIMAAGWALWRNEGAMLWLQQVVAYCL